MKYISQLFVVVRLGCGWKSIVYIMPAEPKVSTTSTAASMGMVRATTVVCSHDYVAREDVFDGDIRCTH